MMMSNLGRRFASDWARELARAYDGEVPPPFYWPTSAAPTRSAARHHPGQLETALPYAALPPEFVMARAVSIDHLDELVERRARREEAGG